MRRRGNYLDPEQADALGISYADRFSVGQFVFEKWNALRQHPLLLARRPLGGERKKLF